MFLFITKISKICEFLDPFFCFGAALCRWECLKIQENPVLQSLTRAQFRCSAQKFKMHKQNAEMIKELSKLQIE